MLRGAEPSPKLQPAQPLVATHASQFSSKSLLFSLPLRAFCLVCIKGVISFLSVSSLSSLIAREVSDGAWSPRRKKVTILGWLSPL